MSTTILEREERFVSTQPTTREKPAWWMQSYSWLFAGVIALNVVVAWPLLRAFIALEAGANGIWRNVAGGGILGACIGQLYLASIWLAFGGLSAPLRFAVVLLAVVLGALSAGLALAEGGWGVEMTICLGVSLLIVLLSQLVLAPVRWLTGWRIDFDAAYQPADSGGRMQLRLWHYLAITFLATLPLIVYRAMEAIAPGENAGGLAITSAILAAMTVLVAAPLTLLVLVKRRSWITWLALPLGMVLAAVLGYGATTAMTSGQAQTPSELVFLFTLPAGALLPVALNLISLRLVGLHLICVKQT